MKPSRTDCGRLPLLVDTRLLGETSRRGRRCPAWTHTWAVCGTPRLPCGARPRGASQNSLRSLRSRRSDNRDENDYEARCARHPVCCAPRRPRDRPRRAPSAARYFGWCSPPRPKAPLWLGSRLSMRPGVLYSPRKPEASPQRRVGTGRSAPLVRREAQGLRPRAQRESSTFSSRLFERRERSERSEFCDGAVSTSIAGQSTRSATAQVKRCGLSPRAFAASRARMQCPLPTGPCFNQLCTKLDAHRPSATGHTPTLNQYGRRESRISLGSS